MSDSGEENISIFLVFFVALLALVLVLAKYLHDHPVLASLLPEAAMVLLVGIVAGSIIRLIIGGKHEEQAIADDDNVDYEDVDDDLSALLSFSPKIFFVALLPPIIFNSGLRIKALFFRHITPIILFAVAGTTVSAVCVAFLLKLSIHFGLCNGFEPTLSELLTFGALISSTDPVSTLAVFQAKRVDPQLFYLVFGESVLNDALSIVLFDAFAKFVANDNGAGKIALGFVEFFLDLIVNSIGSLCLGMLSGLCAALLFKNVNMTNSRLLEICLYILLMYIPFLLAEIMHLSGIVTILFTGISANRYVVPNLSDQTKQNSDVLFRLLAHLSETSIFLELGLSVFGMTGHWNFKFICWSVLACLIGRALNIYPLTFLYNKSLCRVDKDVDTIKTKSKSKISTSNTELKENFDVSQQQAIDEDIITANTSFADQSVSSVMTATPYKRKDLKIRSGTSHMLWFSGLRGAVAYACVRTFPDKFGHDKVFQTTTMAIVLITVFLLGGSTEMMLSFLNISMGVDEEKYMEERLREPIAPSLLTDIDANYVMTFVVRSSTDATTSDAKISDSNITTTTTTTGDNVENGETASQYDCVDNQPTPRHNSQGSLFDYGAN